MPRAIKWLLAVALLTALGVGGFAALSRMNFLGELVRSKALPIAEKEIKANISMGPLMGNPVTGFTASDIVISRSGDKLISAKNVGVDISWTALLRGKARVSLIAVNGVDTSLEAIESLLPKTKKSSDKAVDIPIDTVMITESTLRTKWGVIKFDPSYVYIDNSFYFRVDAKGTVNGQKVAVDGTVEKIYGVWNTDQFTAKLGAGSVAVQGAVYPSMDMTLSLSALNLTELCELVPQLKKYKFTGVLSGNTAIKGKESVFTTTGTGSLHNALIAGIPLEQLDARWSMSPGVVSVDISQGMVFKSPLKGSFYYSTASKDKYLAVNADIQKLKFADWNAQFEKETKGEAIYLNGSISALKVDLKGPLNDLRGKVELSPSEIGYKDVVLKQLSATALFEGQPWGQLKLSALADGSPLSATGRLSFGDKAPSSLNFSVAGYPLEKLLKAMPKEPAFKAAGKLSASGSVKGLYGAWIIGAKLTSPLISADKIGKAEKIAATGSFDMKTGKLQVDNGSLLWNGASLSAKGSLSALSSDIPMAFEGSARNLSIERLYPMLSVLKTLDIEGVAQGRWKLSGTAKAPVVSAEFRTGPGRFRDLRIAAFSSKLSFAGKRLALEPMDIRAAGGRARLSCVVSLPAKRADGTTGPTLWKVTGRAVDVKAEVLDGLLKTDQELSGRVTGDVYAGSAKDSPSGLDWHFRFTSPELQWKNFRAEKLKGDLKGTPKVITVRDTTGTYIKGEVGVNGTITMPPEGRKFTEAELRLAVTGDKLNIYELLRRHLPDMRGVQGLISAEGDITGTPEEPRFTAKARLAPIRVRGFMLPIMDVNLRGNLKDIVINEAHALLRDGVIKGYGRFYDKDGKWDSTFNVTGKNVDMKQFGAYLPDDFRKRFGGNASFSLKGGGPISEIKGSGSFTSPRMRIMGIRLEDINAPFTISKNYIIIEDLSGKSNGGTLSGGVAMDMKESLWGGNLTIMNADLNTLKKQSLPQLKGDITGFGDLKMRGGGETGRLSTVKGGGVLVLRDGQLSSFDAVETAKKYTGGKPLRFSSVRATFTYDGGDFNLLPGSQATAPVGDPLYRYIMLDGSISRKQNLSFYMMGKINIRALNSVIGAFQGLVTAGIDLASGELNKNEMVQNILGGVIGGMAKNDFRFISMNIGGTATEPKFYNVKVERNAKQTSAKDAIPTNQSDPDAKDSINSGNTTFRFNFEIPVGPGTGQKQGDAKGQVVEQTLENLLKNIDFGL